ncbi:DUF2306 domain-containing protein [Cytophagaceae bacterium YF14B1]|uniref:DUF2306 domain-containing protein n=1 Tax=Xanthocytophaga flava TaxID=3048013 RepID=A0AAE3QZ84_9BACT|nr:DUF2306 domain-containing protein [Xanthocytophaga flavus]MDJ1486148.1 DUF2306 domain-containing protein [Xanthocytophaga flavus]
MKKLLFVLICVLALLIGTYPIIYVFVDHKNTFLNSKSSEVLGNIVWKSAFWGHISFGGLSLFIGWRQFGHKFRNKHWHLHRIIGKVYVLSVVISSIAGIYIGFYANGSAVSATGFIVLGLIWLMSTLTAVVQIRKGHILNHQRLMTYSFACAFAAVTLRLWYPLLVKITEDPSFSYLAVAWLCWVPNLIVANFINKKSSQNITSPKNG